jgi:arsenite-transporting ATPase
MLREIAAAGTFLDDEDINRFLSLSLPGLDELMAFLEISSWVEARRYDCIVVDTAPSGHTLRLLAMPEMIGRWLDMLEVLLAKRRYMRRVFSRDRSPDRLDLFVAGWKSSLQRTARLLRDPARTQFVPVTIAEPLGVHETLALLPRVAGPENTGIRADRESAPPGVRLPPVFGRRLSRTHPDPTAPGRT